MNILVAHENMDDKTAYNIVKTIFDKRDDLIAVHKEAAELQAREPEGRGLADPVPPGRDEVLRRKGRQGQLSVGPDQPQPCRLGFSFGSPWYAAAHDAGLIRRRP